MKKIFFIILLACTALAGYAQTNNNSIKMPEPIVQSKFSIGVDGGFGHSFLMPYSNEVFRPSWNAGISAIYAPMQHFGVGLGVNYSVEGAKFKYNNAVTNTDYTVQTELDYVRVPLKAIYFFKTYESDFRPKVSIGPTFGVLVGETNSVNARSIDIGANATIGFNYRLARAIHLNVDANYYQGFLDTYSGNSDNDLNSNIRLQVGLHFGL